jgi:archaellum component FlaF (FlaF/FlaG flagellin family)
MFTSNPFSEISGLISPLAMQAYVILMVLLVAGGTVLDMIHKQSAKYFFKNAEKAKTRATRKVSAVKKVSIAVTTVAVDVLASGEFCNQRRRVAHLLTMYGFILFAATTAIMIFGYLRADTPVMLPLLWHLGALMLCGGGYWFWFYIRVDVAAEGNPWYRVIPADLFILSLLATGTFALLWSFFQAVGATWLSNLFFVLFIFSATVLFGGVLWSKFAHMFFKPAAAFQKRVAKADGSRDGLPPPADKPEQFGLGIKRLQPRNY